MPDARHKQGGFSIIELSIFLAVSGLLLLIAFAGTTTTIATIRFKDSVNTVQSRLQQQYNDILSGVNPRSGNEACVASQVTSGSQAPGRSDCLLLGKIVTFQKDKNDFREYYVVGSEPASLASGLSADQILAAYKPTVVTSSGVEDFEIPWGATVYGTCRNPNAATNACPASPRAVDSYLLLRSPLSGEIKAYTFQSNNLSGGAGAAIAPSSGPDYPNLAVPGASLTAANICLRSADITNQFALLQVGGTTSDGQSGISAQYDITAAQACNGL